MSTVYLLKVIKKKNFTQRLKHSIMKTHIRNLILKSGKLIDKVS